MAIERIVPDTREWDAFYANHIKRYQFAFSKILVDGQIKILDAACGVGYGSYLLSSIVKSEIVSIDRSEEALVFAREKFAKYNIQYLLDDCHTMAKSSALGPFDVIVSFETLEHLPNPEEFLSQCYKNLKVGGKLIISTPNEIVSSIENLSKWEFHEKEYKPEEFVFILESSGFSNVKLYGQYFSSIGKLRKEIRAELNSLLSNPFVRIGKLLQRIFKGHSFKYPLPEQLEDFVISKFDRSINVTNVDEPFVLLAVCEKV